MNIIRKILLGLGGLVVVALVLALASPKAARSAVTTLVTVSNTLANPVVTEGSTTTATQIVALYCNLSETSPLGCVQLMPGGGLGATTYTIPAGQNLVITDVQVNSPGGGGGIQFIELQATSAAQQAPGGNFYQSWYFSNDGATHEYPIAPGLVWPGANPIYVDGLVGATVILRGYLTSQ
jgi:hypothetical protein